MQGKNSHIGPHNLILAQKGIKFEWFKNAKLFF